MGQSVSTPHGHGQADDPNDSHPAFSHNDLVSIALAAHGAPLSSTAAPRLGSPHRRSRSRRPSNGSTHGPMEISNPTDVEQGVHIEWDEETGSFRGVPAQWRAHFARVGQSGVAAPLGVSAGSAPSSMTSPQRTTPVSTSRSAERPAERGGIRRMPSGSRGPNSAGDLQQPFTTGEPLRARSASSSSINATIGVDAAAARSAPSASHAHHAAAASTVTSQPSIRSAHRRSKSSDLNGADLAAAHVTPPGTALRSPPSSSSILASPSASSSRLAKANNPSLSRTPSNSAALQSPSRTRAPAPNLTRPEKSHRRTPSSGSGPLSPGAGSFSSTGAGGSASNPASPSTPQALHSPATPSKSLQSSASLSALGGYGKGIAAAFSATGPNASPGRGGPYAGTPRSPNVDRRPSDPTWQSIAANSNIDSPPSSSATATATSQATPPPSSSSKPPRPSNPNLTIRTASRSPALPRAPPGPMPMSSKGPPPTTPLPERPPDEGPLKPSAADVSASGVSHSRPRRMSARRSRVISISPRGSLMSTTSLVAALAAAVQREEAEMKQKQQQSTLSSRRRERERNERGPLPSSNALIPPRNVSHPKSPTTPTTPTPQTPLASPATARNGSVTSLASTHSTATAAATAAADSLSYQNVQIHPMFQRFIAEAQRLEREQRDNPQLVGPTSLSGTAFTNGSTGSASTAAANSLVQLLKEGALGEAGRELAELTSMEVTPANLDVAMAGLIEPGVTDPHTVFTDIVPFAEGMSGDVHMAKDAVVHSPVAIKIIPRDHARSKDKIKRLPIEVHLMRASRHPNVVSFIGAYLTPDAVWLAMEWMDAGSLADFLYADEEDEEEEERDGSSSSESLAAGPFTAHGIAYVTSQIARALDYMHSNHRLHRDVRSDNILLTLDGQCKLADFGYAIETHAPVCEPVGTPYWIAPEVAKAAARAFAVKTEDDVEVDVLDNDDMEYYGSGVDVWALGITVYEMAARMYPYAELDEAAALQAIAAQGAPQLPDIGRDRLGTSGVGFLSRLLTRDPTERPTAAEVLADSFVRMADMGKGRAQLVALIEQVNGRG